MLDDILFPNDDLLTFDVPLNNDDMQFLTSRKFNYEELDKDFAKKVRQVIDNCYESGVIMVPYIGLRDPWEQAKIWRKTRNTDEITNMIKDLRGKGASFIASVIDSVGAQHGEIGKHLTNAIPGFSWHQWGEAIDSYWEVNGNAEWNSLDGYKVYAKYANQLDLKPGGYWRMQDWPHIQHKPYDSPSDIFSLRFINNEMLKRFGE